MGINTNSFGQLWQLASLEGELWEAIDRIISGTTGDLKAKVPKSASAFTSMGKIPEVDLPLLQSVAQGSSTMKEFQQSCLKYKARARVQSLILTVIQEQDWLAAQAQLPRACSPDFVAQWAHFIVNRKLKTTDNLPKAFFDALDSRRESDKRLKRTQNDLSNQVCLFPHFKGL